MISNNKKMNKSLRPLSLVISNMRKNLRIKSCLLIQRITNFWKRCRDLDAFQARLCQTKKINFMNKISAVASATATMKANWARSQQISTKLIWKWTSSSWVASTRIHHTDRHCWRMRMVAVATKLIADRAKDRLLYRRIRI